MKKIMLGSVRLRDSEQPVALMLRGLLETSPAEKGGRNGYDIATIRARIRVIEKLDAATGDDVTLEDADFDVLKRAVDNADFAIVDRGVLDLYDRVANAEIVA